LLFGASSFVATVKFLFFSVKNVGSWFFLRRITQELHSFFASLISLTYLTYHFLFIFTFTKFLHAFCFLESLLFSLFAFSLAFSQLFFHVFGCDCFGRQNSFTFLLCLVCTLVLTRRAIHSETACY